MDHFAGLDVSVKDTSVCIVDEVGKIVREVKVASEPDALLAVLRNPAYHFKRIGLEAGPLSQWLFCQRRSKNASAGRSKNTSTMLASRAPNWGPSSDIRLGRDYPPVCPSWHGVSGSCSD